MKIYLDIGHPKHALFFIPIINRLQQKGHHFYITARNKDVTQTLLNNAGIKFFDRGDGANGFLRKLIYLFKIDSTTYHLVKRFDPDLCLSFGSPYAAQIAARLKCLHLCYDDTEMAKLERIAYLPFTDKFITPKSYKKFFGKKHIKIDTFSELAYLHPKRFKPDPAVLQKYDLKQNEKYFILRFVSWKATHDWGHQGIGFKIKQTIIDTLNQKGRVFITSEDELPPKWGQYKLPCLEHEFHHLLAFSSFCIGESATVAAEAAVLGVPAIYYDEVGRCYTDELNKKYKLFQYTSKQEDILTLINNTLINNKLAVDNRKNHKKMIDDKVDPVDYIIRVIESYNKE